MISATTTLAKPAIAMTRLDYERLSDLAEAMLSRDAAVAEQLAEELDRARVLDEAEIAREVVRMGSTVRFTSDLGEDRTVTLVFPGEADIARGRISILTPIGVALVGLSPGQSIDWTARDGRSHRLTVRSVTMQSAAEA